MIRLEQIDHVALRCSSLGAAKDWYMSVLGFEHIYPEHGDGVPVFLRLGSTFLTLFPQKGDEQPSSRLWHFAFRAANYADFQSAQAELHARGVAFQFRDHEIAHSIYFSDPDGVLLEITTYDVPQDKKSEQNGVRRKHKMPTPSRCKAAPRRSTMKK